LNFLLSLYPILLNNTGETGFSLRIKLRQLSCFKWRR